MPLIPSTQLPPGFAHVLTPRRRAGYVPRLRRPGGAVAAGDGERGGAPGAQAGKHEVLADGVFFFLSLSFLFGRGGRKTWLDWPVRRPWPNQKRTMNGRLLLCWRSYHRREKNTTVSTKQNLSTDKSFVSLAGPRRLVPDSRCCTIFRLAMWKIKKKGGGGGGESCAHCRSIRNYFLGSCCRLVELAHGAPFVFCVSVVSWCLDFSRQLCCRYVVRSAEAMSLAIFVILFVVYVRRGFRKPWAG